MPNQFVEMPHLLQVAAVRVSDASGYRRTARMIHVVYDVYRATDGDGPIACGRKIAFHLLQVFSEGVWHFDREDDPLLAAMSLPATTDEDVDIADELHGRWIEGRPGPAGPGGFNPLMEAGSITPPPTPPAIRGVTTSPPVPGMGAAPMGPTGCLVAVAADNRPSPGSLNHDSQGSLVSLLLQKQFFDQALAPIAAHLQSIKLELDRLPDRIAGGTQPAIHQLPSSPPEGPRVPAPPEPERAYRAYRAAEQGLQGLGRKITDDEAYAWLEEYGPAEYELPDRDTWKRNLRRGRKHYGDQKHRPVAGRTGRSVVLRSEL